MEKKDGGPAFPTEHAMHGDGPDLRSGMSLRDYFAGQALASMMREFGKRRELEGQEFYELCQSYRHAPLSEQGSVSDRFQAIKKWVIAWHERHSATPQPPTRQQVQDFVADVLRPEKYLSESIDKFPALFSQGSGSRWCVHCKEGKPPAINTWGFLNGLGIDMKGWVACPICATPRPRPEGGDGNS